MASGWKISKLLGEKKSYCPLQILASKTCNTAILKTATASSFKHGQLIENDQ